VIKQQYNIWSGICNTSRVANHLGMAGTVPELTPTVPCPGLTRLCTGIVCYRQLALLTGSQLIVLGLTSSCHLNEYVPYVSVLPTRIYSSDEYTRIVIFHFYSDYGIWCFACCTKRGEDCSCSVCLQKVCKPSQQPVELARDRQTYTGESLLIGNVRSATLVKPQPGNQEQQETHQEMR